MINWKLAKTLWVGALTPLVLFQASADEIEDAFKSGHAAEMTRTEEQKQAARRALESAQRRMQEQAVAQDDTMAQREPETLVGEIGALENLRAKLKQELDELRESNPAPASAPMPAPEPRSAQADARAEPLPPAAGIGNEDLKKQVEPRAAISRQQNELQKLFEGMLDELRADIEQARNEDRGQVQRLVKEYHEQDVRQKQGQAEIKQDMEALLSKEDQVSMVQYRKSLQEDIQTLRAELRSQLQSEIAVLAASIEEEKAARREDAIKQAEQLAGLGRSLSKQIAESLEDRGGSTEAGAGIAGRAESVPKQEPVALTEEGSKKRPDLEALRERLRDSLQQYEEEKTALQKAQAEALELARAGQEEGQREELKTKMETSAEAVGKDDRFEKEGEGFLNMGAEPILLKDETPKKKGLFGWFRRSSHTKQESSQPLLSSKTAHPEKEDAIFMVRAGVGEPESQAVPAQQVSNGVNEKIKKPETVAGVRSIEVPESVESVDEAPLQKGREGELVRGIRGTIDTQMSAMNLELDQHPVFDLGEVDVAPSPGPRAEARAERSWRYEGGWSAGRMHGPGTLTYPDGCVYSGQWKDGVRQGQGKLAHPDGWTFSGEWGEGLIHGEGALTYSDGWAYSGSWKKGKMDGSGALRHPEGWTYTGEWKKGHMDGDGALSHPDGWKYEGNWEAGKRSGKGRLTFSDGWTYDGDWKNGTMNGSGTLQHPDGWAYEGEWENGELAGDGKIVFKQ